MISVVEEPTPQDKFTALPLDELNCCETISSGEFAIYDADSRYTYVFDLEVDPTEDVSTLISDLSGLTGTAYDADGNKVMVSDGNGGTTEKTTSIGSLVSFEASDGVIVATDESAGGISFKNRPGGSNFLIQTNLSNVKPETDDGGTKTYTSTVMNMSATITEAGDITADDTQLYKSLSFGKDGMLTVTYSDGSVLTVKATEDGASTYFSYTDAGGVIIDGNVQGTDEAPLYVDPNVLVKANMQLQIAKVTNDSGLVAVGDNCYEVGVDCGKVIYTAAGINGTGTVVSGALESSNVDLAQQFANMILAQRLVQANSQVFNSANSILETLVYLGR
jgi:flagellar hook protein FlgE